jgi:hypothetical protein
VREWQTGFLTLPGADGDLQRAAIEKKERSLNDNVHAEPQ